MKNLKTQRGNVLFLILIAVALFAALSYAVTQSSRSGGDASRETTILNAAQLTQYPTSVRTAVLRLVIDGYQDTTLLYNKPASITSGSEPIEIFATLGGGAIYQNAPSEMMEQSGSNPTGQWYFNMDFEIDDLGRTGVAGVGGNELIAFLPGVTESVCSRINQEAGIIASAAVSNPAITGDVYGGSNGDVDFSYTAVADVASATNIDLGEATVGSASLSAQPFGCFQNTGSGNEYVFYAVLLER